MLYKTSNKDVKLA